MSNLTQIQKLEREVKSIFDKASDEFNLKGKEQKYTFHLKGKEAKNLFFCRVELITSKFSQVSFTFKFMLCSV